MLRNNILNPTSDKRFGLFCSSIFALGTIYYLFFQSSSYTWKVLLFLTILTILLAIYSPNFFCKLNSAWFNLAILMGHIFNPIVLGAIYFLVLTPIAVITKFFGRDELLLKKSDQKTYWLVKDSALKNSQSYRDQF
jgi:hypothetical protein